MNEIVIQNSKKKEEASKKSWREILLELLWAYSATPKSNNKETSFALVYDVISLI